MKRPLKKDRIIELYFNQGLETWQIAERVGCKRTVVTQIISEERQRRRAAGHATD